MFDSNCAGYTKQKLNQSVIAPAQTDFIKKLKLSTILWMTLKKYFEETDIINVVLKIPHLSSLFTFNGCLQELKQTFGVGKCKCEI